ncbi:MAG TPA: nuclease-related domain-containing protein [Kiritimatiellia bacterium]|nr:nuclease-related domain-containing protein [Kiritimatiellia bacterium]
MDKFIAELLPYAIFLALFPVVVAGVKRWFKARGKGKIGEFAVNSILRRGLPDEVYHLIPNVMLPAGGGTTQIDHVVVSRYGIFVIETKAMKGGIFGQERERQWTQVLFRQRHPFQNPLHQNYRHTKTLSELTEIPHHYFISLVAFSGEAAFKTPMPPSVVHIRDIARTVMAHTAVLIQDAQVPEVVDAIEAWARTVGADDRRNHVRNLQARFEGKRRG